MNRIEERIIETIQKEGPISFECFMEMALYFPGLGYYSSSGTSIGRDGDFYTSPHLHPIFGAMIGRQFIEMWKAIERPSDFFVIEMGAGVGYVCRDMCEYMQRPSDDAQFTKDKLDFSGALKYIIVEPYDHFRETQKKLLSRVQKNSPLDITWVQSLNGLERGLKGCIFSNELLDAFPVHIVEMHDGLKEVYINYDGSEFYEELRNVSSEDVQDYMKHFAMSLQPEYRTEINLGIRDWLIRIREVLSQGFILTVDYGYTAGEYYSETRTQGTLLCYHKHLFNDNPYQHIGEQDITAHVNFSALKKWGEDYGFTTLGYSPQGTYLVSAGIDEVISELYADSPDYLSEVSKIKGLIMPQGMGESHNVMVQYKGDGTPALRGFSMRNLMGSL